MAYYCDNSLFFSLPLTSTHILSVSYLSLLPHQAAQLAYILDGRLKELADDASLEKALKDMAEVTAKEKTKVAATVGKKAGASERVRAAAKK